jgi:hypothetical protein
MHAVFDASANHKARAEDALHVGSLGRRAGGVNAPGAPLRDKKGEHRPTMRDGWYMDAEGERQVQHMHRDKVCTDDKKNKPAIFNADGSICKGVEEILNESGDKCVAEDNIKMPFSCSHARRNKLHFPTSKSCMPGRRCCMENTLRWRPDFAAQKSRLEEVCASCDIVFHMLPICHPELNPIEGSTYPIPYIYVRYEPILPELNPCKGSTYPTPYIYVNRFLELYQEVCP